MLVEHMNTSIRFPQASGPRVGIVASEPMAPSQTFVRRQIEGLFGGQTAVLHQAPCNLSKPRYRFPNDTVTRGLRRLQRMADSPLGANVSGRITGRGLDAFIAENGVSFLIYEFGTYLQIYGPTLQRFSLPFAVYFCGYDASEYLRDPRYVAALRRRLPEARFVCAVSCSLMRNLEAHGITHPNSLILPSGTDTSAFVPSQTRRPGWFLSIGRFVDKKKHDLSIEAFAQAAKDHPEAQLHLVGNGPKEAACRALAARLDVADRVHFHGALPHDQVRDLLAQASIYLQHSVKAPNGDEEGLPTAIQEAMSCGLPVIATRHAGIPEIITHEENGLLVEEHDLQGYAAQIARLLADPDMAGRLGRNARDYAASHLDYRVMYQKLEDEIIRHVPEFAPLKTQPRAAS
jgi:colanic acid/amylovoran biosynthesis glycosyltransferase